MIVFISCVTLRPVIVGPLLPIKVTQIGADIIGLCDALGHYNGSAVEKLIR